MNKKKPTLLTDTSGGDDGSSGVLCQLTYDDMKYNNSGQYFCPKKKTIASNIYFATECVNGALS